MRNLSINNLVQMGSNGLMTANFTQIRQALIERYQMTYGLDIDLSTGSADGIFVNDIALMINNILETMANLYNNLDIDRASGVYLTNLCKLSNVYRMSGSYSWTYLTVKNSSDEDLTLVNTVFVDKSGLEWICPDEVIIPAYNPNYPDRTTPIKVICTQRGAIEAPKGWINKTLELLPLVIEQRIPAKLGTYDESDAALRARRNRFSSSKSVSVLNGLMSNLLDITGIKDVLIYNNNTDTDDKAQDDSDIVSHSIYIVLRTDPTIDIENKIIGLNIHKLLTPGIRTCEFNGDDSDAVLESEAKTYLYQDSIYGQSIIENAQNVYWKQAGSVAPSLTITIYPNDTFGGYSEIQEISNYLMQTFNELPLGTKLELADVMFAILYADPKYTGKATYNQILPVLSDGSSFPYIPKDRYYDYNDFVCGLDENGTWDSETETGYDTVTETWVFKLINNGGGEE